MEQGNSPIVPHIAPRSEDPVALREALDDAQGSLRAIRSVIAPLLGVPENSDPADVLVARYVADRGAVAATYVRDRAGQYYADSASYSALIHVAAELKEGRHLAAHKHGELDDLLAPPVPATQPEACPPTKPGGEP